MNIKFYGRKAVKARISLQVFLCIVIFFGITSCGPELPADVAVAYDALPDKLDYNIHVKPILSDRCFACHGNDAAKQKANLRLDLEAFAFNELSENPGKHAIVKGNLSRSEVFHRITNQNEDMVMPPPEFNLPLSAEQKAILIKWIEDGAEYKSHWAFDFPVKTELPSINNKSWCNNEIDQYILKELENKKWAPQQEADKEILLRRVTFDLTGLPPTPEEIDNFKNDASHNAYEEVVDRLLGSKAYGEMMAVSWMDLSRFADTHGFTVDRYRDMSPWRDWVINAFNENMSYDKFVTWQLAGDLIPNATREQILATGFNRNHQQNMEGGIIEEEYRSEYVSDRTNTLGTAFMALTLGCAKCHDHKYDPISQKEYFQLYSFFNNVKEAGQISFDNATPVPTMLLTNQEVEEVTKFIAEDIDKINTNLLSKTENQLSQKDLWMTRNRKTERIRKYPYKTTAFFDMNDKQFRNKFNRRQRGKMQQQNVDKVPAYLEKSPSGQALALDGDAWLDLGKVGVYDRYDPFSISVRVKIPENLSDGVIFHKGKGAAIYNFRGYHLALKENRLEMGLIHTAPYNNILEYVDHFPRDQWMDLTMTYDGSGKAAGLKLYLDGNEAKTKVEMDNLYKTLLFDSDKEPGLQIGARWRGRGLKGGKIDNVLVVDRELTALEIIGIADRQKMIAILKKNTDDLSAIENQLLIQFYEHRYDIVFLQMNRNLKTQRRKIANIIDKVPEIMVMDEMETPRNSYILKRGVYNSYGAQVFPGTPQKILPMPEHLPKNRLGLAQWLFDEKHPLTSRVAVNRIWQQFFGKGIVASSDDFGFQGKMPSHPELLDRLSIDFMESGWDVKALVKKIVMSATYKQSSKTSKALKDLDSDNIFLARGPSGRLSAERLRDNVLAASGLLNKKVGGKSVKPYQPAGLWKVNGSTYIPATGTDLYRRSLYTFWKRTVPNPTQSTFDAPTRSACTIKRQKTSTPLQALVLLNDPTFNEAAKVLGSQIAQAESVELAIENVFKSLTGRTPSKEELDLLVRVKEKEKEKFIKNPAKMEGWLKAGDSSIKESKDLYNLAAGAVVASTIINADATIVKR